MIGAIITLKTTHPTNCFVSRFASVGKWFFMFWKLGKIAARTFWTHKPPVLEEVSDVFGVDIDIGIAGNVVLVGRSYAANDDG